MIFNADEETLAQESIITLNGFASRTSANSATSATGSATPRKIRNSLSKFHLLGQNGRK